MSNRQARREQMRSNRQERAQRATPSRPQRPTGSGGGPSGNPFLAILKSPFYLLLGAVIIALVGVLVFIVSNRSTDKGDIPTKLAAAEAVFPADLAKGTKLGKDDAPLKLVQFEDFQCPFCLRYTAEDEPGIVEEFVKTGKVQIEFKHFPILGQESIRSAQASFCAAEQDKFWQYHNLLFRTQGDAGQFTNEKKDAGRFSDGKLRDFAEQVGLDIPKYEACFVSEEALAKVQTDLQEGQRIGIRGTPGFTINGLPLAGGAPDSIEGWRTLLNEQLNKPSPSPAATGTASATTAAPSATTAAATATRTP